MNYIETLEYIHSLGNFSMPVGLDRIKMVMQKLGNPQNGFKSIHVAGTNGKGSLCAMLSSVFCKSGYKTGLFISPFIIDFRERIQINGEYISENDLVIYAEKIKSLEIKLTEFEFITAVAFLYFKDKNCDIVICETGLGGRFDATNCMENKIATVITKIGLDHTAILGDTIEKIATEKCGIIRDCPCITNPYQKEEVLGVIKKASSQLILPELNELKITVNSRIGNTFIYKGNEYKVSLSGEFQIENAITAIETINNCGYDIPYTYIYKGLESAFIPARMEIIKENPLIILDGAHNPDGAEVLAKELKKFEGKAVAIIGMMKDKDYEEFLSETLKHCRFAVAVEVKNMPRSLKADELCNTASEFCECISVEEYETAIKIAIEKAGENPIFIFGSLYLAADIRKLFKKNT